MENWIDGFLESQGWNAPVVTDENLMMEYPRASTPLRTDGA